MRKNLLKIILLDALMTTLIVSLTMTNVGMSSPGPVIYVDPPKSWAAPGDPVNIDVKVSDIAADKSLCSWEFDMSFDSNILNVNEETNTADNELANGTVKVKQLPWANFTISPGPPYIWHTDLTFNASSSTPDGGELINPSSYYWDFGDLSTAYGNVTTHKYMSTGDFTVTLNVTDTEGLWDTELQTITIVKSASVVSSTENPVGKTVTDETEIADNVLVDGVSTASEGPIRDVAVTNVVSSPSTVVGAYNQTVYINITVRNNPLSYQRESFTVIAYANATSVGETTGSLNPGESQTYTIAWKTTSSTTPSNYTIKGKVPPLIGVGEGPFLKSAGTTRLVGYKADNIKGTVVASWSLFPYKVAGAVGSGTLGTIFFKVKAEGKTTLHFYKTQLFTYDGSWVWPITHTTADGIFTMIGDIDSDGDVDASDLFRLGRAYGSTLGGPNWNPDADLNKDNIVNLSDLSLLNKNYGKGL